VLVARQLDRYNTGIAVPKK